MSLSDCMATVPQPISFPQKTMWEVSFSEIQIQYIHFISHSLFPLIWGSILFFKPKPYISPDTSYITPIQPL